MDCQYSSHLPDYVSLWHVVLTSDVLDCMYKYLLVGCLVMNAALHVLP